MPFRIGLVPTVFRCDKSLTDSDTIQGVRWFESHPTEDVTAFSVEVGYRHDGRVVECKLLSNSLRRVEIVVREQPTGVESCLRA